MLRTFSAICLKQYNQKVLIQIQIENRTRKRKQIRAQGFVQPTPLVSGNDKKDLVFEGRNKRTDKRMTELVERHSYIWYLRRIHGHFGHEVEEDVIAIRLWG